MIISMETFRARIKSQWDDRKALVMDEDYTLQEKFYLLQAWVDGLEAIALLGGMDARIAEIIDEVTGDTLAALANALKLPAGKLERSPMKFRQQAGSLFEKASQ
jgi:hypothetical protein